MQAVKSKVFREVMEFSWWVLLLISNVVFADLSKSSPNVKIDPGPKPSPELDPNQKENPSESSKEEEGVNVQPNIILVLVTSLRK